MIRLWWRLIWVGGIEGCSGESGGGFWWTGVLVVVGLALSS